MSRDEIPFTAAEAEYKSWVDELIEDGAEVTFGFKFKKLTVECPLPFPRSFDYKAFEDACARLVELIYVDSVDA